MDPLLHIMPISFVAPRQNESEMKPVSVPQQIERNQQVHVVLVGPKRAG